MHFVKDKPIVTIHRSSGSHWEIIDREIAAITDTRPISQIPITEFVKPQQHFWKPDNGNLADDQIAEFARQHKEFIDRQLQLAESFMESQSVDRAARAEEFKKMVMGHWHTENAPVYYINTKGKKVGEMSEVMIGPSRSGKSMINMHIAKHRHNN